MICAFVIVLGGCVAQQLSSELLRVVQIILSRGTGFSAAKRYTPASRSAPEAAASLTSPRVCSSASTKTGRSGARSRSQAARGATPDGRLRGFVEGREVRETRGDCRARAVHAMAARGLAHCGISRSANQRSAASEAR
jgi:hypothetical protein